MNWKKFVIATTVVVTVMIFCKIFGIPSQGSIEQTMTIFDVVADINANEIS